MERKMLTPRKLTRKVLEKVGSVCIGASKKIYCTQKEFFFKKWIKNHGDKTLRLTYELSKNSIVFDVGGYEGQWASDVYAKYNCTIHIFEPVQPFVQQIKNRFKNNKRIIIHDFGLSNKTTQTTISLEHDASSLYLNSNNKVMVKIIDIYEFIKQKNIHEIDLIKINIEGGEYDLLERIIQTGLVTKIKNIQVQFHDFIPNAQQKMTAMQNQLKKTHQPTYQYPFIWENWQIKRS